MSTETLKTGAEAPDLSPKAPDYKQDLLDSSREATEVKLNHLESFVKELKGMPGVKGVNLPLLYPESSNATGFTATLSLSEIEEALTTMGEIADQVPKIISGLFNPDSSSEYEFEAIHPADSDYFGRRSDDLTYGCRQIKFTGPKGAEGDIIIRSNPISYEQAKPVEGNGEVQISIRLPNGVHVRWDQVSSIEGKDLGLYFDIGDSGLRRNKAEMEELFKGGYSASMKLGLALAMASVYRHLADDGQLESTKLDDKSYLSLATEKAPDYHHHKVSEDFSLQEAIRAIFSARSTPNSAYEGGALQLGTFTASEAITPESIKRDLKEANLRFPDRVFEVLMREMLLADLFHIGRVSQEPEILDIGAGSGLVTEAIANSFGGTATALDSSPAMMTDLPLQRVKKVIGSMTDIDMYVPPESVDLLMSFMALHYLSSPDLKKVFGESYNSMKPRTSGIISLRHPQAMPLPQPPNNPEEDSVCADINLSNTGLKVTEYGHSPEHLKLKLEQAGFKDVKIYVLDMDSIREMQKRLRESGNHETAKLIDTIIEAFPEEEKDGRTLESYESKLEKGGRITFITFKKP